MDVNEALTAAREAVADLGSATSISMSEAAAERLAAAFRVLDDSLSTGGDRPDAWRAFLSSLPPVETSEPGTRFEVRKDAVHRAWGVWDNQVSLWHEGEYDDAYSAAGIPMWTSEDRAREIVADLNGARA